MRLDANNYAWTRINAPKTCDGKETLNCTHYPNTVMRIRYAEFVPCNDSGSESCLRPFIAAKPQLHAEIKKLCAGRSQCTILMQSLTSDPCPSLRKYLNVPYKCEVKPSSYPGMNDNSNLCMNFFFQSDPFSCLVTVATTGYNRWTLHNYV